jgi:hypothetical protein
MYYYEYMKQLHHNVQRWSLTLLCGSKTVMRKPTNEMGLLFIKTRHMAIV